ncbi:hypothetical protein DAI22_01g113300 [Oryza sativa Japonica Group]|nr:hypothetical protein DAI22_01g113300 [Oryza sativa Japonica Group]
MASHQLQYSETSWNLNSTHTYNINGSEYDSLQKHQESRKHKHHRNPCQRRRPRMACRRCKKPWILREHGGRRRRRRLRPGKRLRGDPRRRRRAERERRGGRRWRRHPRRRIDVGHHAGSRPQRHDGDGGGGGEQDRPQRRHIRSPSRENLCQKEERAH